MQDADPRVEFVYADAAKTGLPDGSASLVSLSLVVHELSADGRREVRLCERVPQIIRWLLALSYIDSGNCENRLGTGLELVFLKINSCYKKNVVAIKVSCDFFVLR